MGCDIHAHVELRVAGKWEHYATPSIDRRYRLFGAMAGVRGEVPAIVKPKGVPDDMSVITRLDWEKWGVDAHTPSWLNEEELDLLQKWLDAEKIKVDKKEEKYPCMFFDLEAGVLNRTYMFGNSLTAFKHYTDYEYIPKNCDAVRLVFWFDN
jgi:hypothetical protein